jgi:hypothetical protein
MLLLRVGKSASSRRGRSTSRYKEVEGWAGATATGGRGSDTEEIFFTGESH